VVPLQVSVGNHDADGQYARNAGGEPSIYGDDAGGECGVQVKRRLRAPGGQVAGANGQFWYSFQQENVHIAVISTEHALLRVASSPCPSPTAAGEAQECSSKQLAWLRRCEKRLLSLSLSLAVFRMICQHRLLDHLDHQ
jgi:hypothetical protein